MRAPPFIGEKSISKLIPRGWQVAGVLSCALYSEKCRLRTACCCVFKGPSYLIVDFSRRIFLVCELLYQESGAFCHKLWMSTARAGKIVNFCCLSHTCIWEKKHQGKSGRKSENLGQKLIVRLGRPDVRSNSCSCWPESEIPPCYTYHTKLAKNGEYWEKKIDI